MEEPASWKGHSFTLLVFGGIVVLCLIFFVLGMLVGRDQGQRIAEMAAVEAANEKPATEGQPEPLPSFYQETTEPEPTLDLTPAPEPTTSVEPPADEPPPEVPAATKYFLQILATENSKEADRELAKVKSKKFRALILPPSPGDKDALYRVQVGPYDSIPDAELAKKELQTHGYKDVFRK